MDATPGHVEMSQASSFTPRPSLRSNALTLWPIVALGLAYMSLAPAAYFNIGFMESQAGGPVMPLVYILVTLAILPTAISFAIMNNRRPSAGSAFTWLWEATAPPIGLWVGWLLTTVYFTACAIYPGYMAVFFNPFLEYFGIHISYWTGAVAGLALVVVIAYMIRHDIQFSAKTIAIFMVFEAGFLLLFSLYVIIRQAGGGHLSLTPFNPAAATSSSGLILALIFGVLSIAGVDSVAPVAEESRAPRSLIPLATILVTIAAGAFWTFAAYALAVAVPAKTIVNYVNAGLVTPWYPVADAYIGPLKILVPITAFSASLASFGASAVCASRMLYAMAREGYAPSTFAQLDHKYQSPWHAAIPALLIAAVVPIALGYWLGNNASAATGWLGGAFVFFVLIPYALVNVANLVYHLRYQRWQFHWLTTGLIPLLGIVIDLYILYKGFFQAYMGLSFQTGKSIVYFCVTWALLGALWATTTWLRRRGQTKRVALQSNV